MTKIFNILSYYILLLLGLIATSWIIWGRFLRERVIRDIPDASLTELRFWILCYLCCIYILIIKNLIKEPKSNYFLTTLGKIINTYIWKPLLTLDHTIKYNIYCKDYYTKFIIYFITYWDTLSTKMKRGFILGFQILPRIVLVTILLFDIFYFNKIEIFYKFILIGLLPFSFRYISYSMSDFYDYLVKQLTDKYDDIHIYEKGYAGLMSHKGKTKAIWHYELVSVEEYIEIMYDTYIENIRDETSYSYEGTVYCKKHILQEYEKKFNKSISAWSLEDCQEVQKLFHELAPIIIDLKITLYLFNFYKKEKNIIWTKIFIFSMYLICWGFVLIISYYYYPIELSMFKYFIMNLMKYLISGGDYFTGELHSLNKNLITIDSIKTLVLNIIDNILNRIKK